MLEFDQARFADALRSAMTKETKQVIPEARKSPYIKKLLDLFEKEGVVNLSMVDWDAFELEDVTPNSYISAYQKNYESWIMGFIRFCKTTPVFRRRERSFF